MLDNQDLSVDDRDLLILKTIKDNSGVSLEEIREVVRCNSVATVHNRVVALQTLGLIHPPVTKKRARSRKITEMGVRLLAANKIF